MRKYSLVILLMANLLSESGCITSTTRITTFTKGEGNLTLFVRNQSVDIRKLDISIVLDGRVVVDRLFGRRECWCKFRFPVSPGAHVIIHNVIIFAE
jgi:hypothetical protein